MCYALDYCSCSVYSDGESMSYSRKRMVEESTMFTAPLCREGVAFSQDDKQLGNAGTRKANKIQVHMRGWKAHQRRK